MQTIIPGLYTFTGLIVGRVYLIEDPDGLTLIDTSIPSAGLKILQQIRDMGRQPADIKRILITHAHPDHVGSLPQLKRATGAEVIASALERPVIEGQTPIPRSSGRWQMPETTLSGTAVDHIVGANDILPEVMGGLHVLFTPGHAPGHLSFWQPVKGVLFCGDVLFNAPNLRLPPQILTVNPAENRRSVQKLADLEPKIVCFGHGRPLRHDAPYILRHFARKLPQ